jgi:hypothetical protein
MSRSSRRPASSTRLGSAVLVLASVAFVASTTASCARGADSSVAPIPPVDAGVAPIGVVSCDADASPAGATALTAPVPSASPEAATPTDDGGDDVDDVEDDADGGDDATSTAPPATSSPVGLGDLAITEVMLAPSGPEPGSEWFEVYNTTATPKSLDGLTIEDGYLDSHLIASTSAVVPPFSYVVLARNRAAAIQTLVPPACIVYEYGAGVADDEGIELDTGDAGDLSLWRDDTLLVDVPYGMWNAAFVGQSIELASPQSAEGDPNSWCLAETSWAAGSDDGTPGAPSDCGP